MRLSLILFALSLHAQTFTTVCNGDTSGANGGCALNASTMPNSRGFLNGLPYDSVNGEFLYYTGTATGNTNNASIYSSEIWGYNASTRTFAFRVGNGASSISTGAGNTRCGQEGSPASTYNPLVGHPQGYLDFDDTHGQMYATWQLCGGNYMGYTAFYVAASHTFGTALAKAPLTTGDGTTNATGRDYRHLTWVSGAAKGIFCCDNNSTTYQVVEFDGTTTYTDVSGSVTGADSMACSSSSHCPPAPLTAFAAMSDGTNLWIYGGCNGTTPGSTGASNACSGTNQNDLYKYAVATKIFTKISPSGTKPVATYASFPFAAYSSTRGSILVYSDNNTLKEYTIATNTWSTVSTSGSGPAFGDGTGNSLANHMDGNLAGWDVASNRLVLIHPGACSGCFQSTSPAVYDVTFPSTTTVSKLGGGKIMTGGAIRH